MPGDSASASRAKNIVSGIRSLTIQNLVNSVVGFFFLGTLLRFLSPSDYGLYSAVSLVVGIGSSVASFGLQSAATRFVAMMAHNEGESRVISRSIVELSLMITSACTIVFILLSPALSLYFTKSTDSSWIFAMGGAWLFSITISGIFQGLVQGMKKYHSLALILMVSNLVMVCVTVIGLLEFHSVIVPIVAWTIYGALICFWSLEITKNNLMPASSSLTHRRTFKQALTYSIPLAFAGILTIATNAADPMVVGGLLNETRLGAYNLAISISGGLGAILFAPLNTAFFPESSSSATDHRELSVGLRLAFRYSLLALVPVSFAVAALSKQLINLFSGGGASYVTANLPLQLMSCFFVFIAMQGIPTSLMLSIGKTTQVLMVGIVTVVLNLALSILLVPGYGLLGATTSRILVDIAGFLLSVYLTRKYLSGVADNRFYGKVLVSSFIMLVVLLMLTTFVSSRVVTLIPYALIGGAVLILCIRGFGLLNEEDKRYLEHAVPPKLAKLIHSFL